MLGDPYPAEAARPQPKQEEATSGQPHLKQSVSVLSAFFEKSKRNAKGKARKKKYLLTFPVKKSIVYDRYNNPAGPGKR